MKKIQPKNGVNLRLHPHDVGENQFVFMQNVDMGHSDKHDEHYKMIKGSVKYHGTSIGTNIPTLLTVYYDNSRDVAHVMVCVDDKIMRKNQGSNEFEVLYSGLTPNRIKNCCQVRNRMFFAHPDEGLYEYDGYSVRFVNNSPKVSDIIFSKEVNRAFAIDAANPDSFVWTDDVVDSGGVPTEWNAMNVDVIPSTEGDIEEKIVLLNGRLVHLRTNGIWIYYIGGAPSTWRPEHMPVNVGLIAPKTVQLVNNEIWFLGHSTTKGRGLFAFDGQNERLLSFDQESILYRINPYRIKEASAEYIGNIYKLSFSVDSEIENNHTLHYDAIYSNPETNLPNAYGVHTYGFETSIVLNTRQFGGEHIFARKYNDGAWVFKVDDVYTQYGNPMVNDGDLIPVELITPIYETEDVGDKKADVTWIKRYERFIAHYPSIGAWTIKVEVFKSWESFPCLTFTKEVKGKGYSIEEMILNSNPINKTEVDQMLKTMSVLGNTIQFRISNEQLNQFFFFSDFRYDSRPIRRIKEAQRVHV